MENFRMLQHPLLTIAGMLLSAAPNTAPTLPTDPAVPMPTATASPAPTSPTSTVSPTSTATVSPTATASPTPTVSPAATLTVPAHRTVAGPITAIPWPKTGHAQLEVAGIGPLGRSGNRKAVPIASITKVMTAYLVLRDHPLAAGENGPTIVVTAAEAASYARRRAAGESLVKVAAGERISERRALQGLLIASGNNMADILARWDAGTKAAFIQKMNSTAVQLGLGSTHYADTSGLSSRSRSTTADLLTLAPMAMADATFASIVAQTSATIPLNKIKNTNGLLGRHGVIGIKTGTTRAAGGCLLFATRRTIAGQVVTVYGALLGAPGPTRHTNALKASDTLIVAARKSLRSTTLLPAQQPVAKVTAIDGTVTWLAPARNVTTIGWPGQSYTLALPDGLVPGQIPTTMTARFAARTLTVPLIPVPAPTPPKTTPPPPTPSP